MSVQPVVQYASRTDVGMRRTVNQDSLAVRLCRSGEEWVSWGHLFVVADGMGGHAVGDLASRIAVETLPLAFLKADAETPADRLTRAVEAANRAIHDKAVENPEFANMGTTCSVLALSAGGAWVAHVGDSRVYRIRGGVAEQLTFDHSLQWEMIRQGQATAETAGDLHPANVITRCLGPDQDVQIDIEGPFDVQHGDRFLLCSDGLTGHVADSEIGATIALLPATEASRLLVDLANCRGGSDNTTVVIAVIDDYPPVAGSTVDSQRPAPFLPGSVLDSTIAGRSVWSRLSLGLFAALSISGLVLLMLDHHSPGLFLVSIALLQGCARLILSTGGRSDGGRGCDGAAETSGLDVPGDIAAHAPYRATSAALQTEFLDQLADAQSELTDTARKNGWKLDLEQLFRISDQAKDAAVRHEPVGTLRERARALELLMKTVTHYTRSRE